MPEEDRKSKLPDTDRICFLTTPVECEGDTARTTIVLDDRHQGWLGVPHGGVLMSLVLELAHHGVNRSVFSASNFPIRVSFRWGGPTISLGDPLATGGTRALNYLFLVPLGLVLNGLPLAPAGVGVFEWALGFLFATVLVAGEPNLGANVAALGHVIIIITNLFGLVFYLKGKRRVAQALQDAERDDHAPEPTPNHDA